MKKGKGDPGLGAIVLPDPAGILNLPMAGRQAVDIPSDVSGSYTGLSHDGSRPVQDADDL